MHVHFIVNPTAGRQSAVPLTDAVRTALGERGLSTSAYVTTAAGDAGAHAAGLAPDALTHLVSVGGDGTVSEIVNGCAGRVPWPIGIVPMGTANLVARELRMPLSRDPAAIAEALSASAPWRVDLIRLRGPAGTRHAIANVGAGIDGEIVRTIATLRQGSPGSGAYVKWVRPILSSVFAFDFPALRIHVDERRTYAASACVIQNAQNYGGVFRLSPTAGMDSGALDVTLMRTRSRRDLARYVVAAATRRLARDKDITVVRGDRVRVEAPEPVAVQADGDPAGTTDLAADRIHGGLELMRAPPPR